MTSAQQEIPESICNGSITLEDYSPQPPLIDPPEESEGTIFTSHSTIEPVSVSEIAEVNSIEDQVLPKGSAHINEASLFPGASSADTIPAEQEEPENDLIDTGAPGENVKKKQTLLQLPLSRVKHIIKFDPDVSMASQEAVFLITKATELFIQSFAKDAHSICSKGKKKTIKKSDVEDCISEIEEYSFLAGAIDADVWNKDT